MSYIAPTDLAEALAFLTTPRARIVAGCTDYFPGRAVAEIDAPLLDITRIDGFREISDTPEGWRIGAAVTWVTRDHGHDLVALLDRPEVHPTAWQVEVAFGHIQPR